MALNQLIILFLNQTYASLLFPLLDVGLSTPSRRVAKSASPTFDSKTEYVHNDLHPTKWELISFYFLMTNRMISETTMFSKRRGFVAIVFLFSAIIFIIPTLALTFRQTLKFSDLTTILIAQKQEKIAISTSTNESIEHLLSEADSILSLAVSVNPSSSLELLVYKKSETFGDNTLSSEIYYMNYVISDDSAIFDVLNFPPSQKTFAGERHLLVKTTLYKNNMPSLCEENAIEITVFGDFNKFWHREFVFY
jgi:hypothetical protein